MGCVHFISLNLFIPIHKSNKWIHFTCWLKIYYNSTCFIDHIFLKGYHPSINQHLITVIIMNGVKQSSNFSTMNEIQSTFWLNGMVCWFVWWWLMEWLCCPFTQLRWLRVVSYRFSFQHQLQSTINQTNQFISLC